MPGTAVKRYDNLGVRGQAIAENTIQSNQQINDLDTLRMALSLDVLLGWFGVGANASVNPMARGSTDTRVATAALTGSIAGVPFSKAADAAGTAFGALGTIAASRWGIIAVDVVAAGTVTYAVPSGYAAGYATEALAIAALPPRLTAKVRLGYLTILATASTWVTGTDALAGGASGTPATTTNYYPNTGILQPTGTEKTGGANGILISPGLAIGSTDTRASSLAFTYNANGLTNIPKAATTATSIGALGTIPADKWGIVVMLIDGAGAITFMSGPSNYTTGYSSDADAQAALASIYPAAGLCFPAYFTVKTKAATAFIFATDSLAGGATGNVASQTNYYSVPGLPIAEGLSASLIASRQGVVLTSAQY